jgi:hypothetical protein
MTLFPVIARELSIRSRQGTTYWARCGAAGLATLFALYSLGTFAGALSSTAAGSATFASLSWLSLLVACASIALTADCLSVERREGTLGLLFLTRLRTIELVLGKLVAAGLMGLFALIGALPALALALLSGGVTGGQVARTALSIISLLFVALAAGLFASARSHTQAQAFRWAAILLSILLIGPWLVRIVAWLSPLSSFFHAWDLPYHAHPSRYWAELGIALGEGVLLLAGAARLLRRSWRQIEKPVIPLPRRLAARSRPKSDRRAGLLDHNPVCWLSLRLHDQSALIWLGAFLMIFSGPALSIFVVASFGAAAGGIGPGIHFFSSFVPAIIFAWAAGKFFLEGRQNGELELLLSTPLGGRDIVRGRWNALLIRFRAPLLLAGFVMFLEFIFSAGAGRLLTLGASSITFQLAMVPVNRVLDAIAVFWVGMWFGMRAKRPVSIIIWPVGLVIALPWVLSYIILVMASLLSKPSAGPLGAVAGFFWWSIAWPVVEVAKNILFIRWAAHKLKTEFRTLAPVPVGDWLQERDELLGNTEPPAVHGQGTLLAPADAPLKV